MTTCAAPLWPDDTDWANPAIDAAWVAQWPLCGAALRPEQAGRFMAYCDVHEADWHNTLAAFGAKGGAGGVATADPGA
jgi:hypothetical protein